jgi:hypothetical protein
MHLHKVHINISFFALKYSAFLAFYSAFFADQINSLIIREEVTMQCLIAALIVDPIVFYFRTIVRNIIREIKKLRLNK